MLTKLRRVYALADYTVEWRAGGWYYARTGRFGEKSEMKGPYGSVASVTLMIARALLKEVNKRDARYSTAVPHLIAEERREQLPP
jgi:hypothetical protein